VNRKETLIKKEGGNIQIAEKAVYKSVFLTVWHSTGLRMKRNRK